MALGHPEDASFKKLPQPSKPLGAALSDPCQDRSQIASVSSAVGVPLSPSPQTLCSMGVTQQRAPPTHELLFSEWEHSSGLGARTPLNGKTVDKQKQAEAWSTKTLAQRHTAVLLRQDGVLIYTVTPTQSGPGLSATSSGSPPQPHPQTKSSVSHKSVA